MREERIAQVAHHELTYRCGKPRLRQPDPAVNDGDYHHQPCVDGEEADISLWDRFINEQLQ